MYPVSQTTVLQLTEKPTLDAVKAAIKAVLSQDKNVDRKTASDWLESFKNSVFAWEICDQLLATRESIEISYLAAHMLRHKIAKNFNELPQTDEYHLSLRDAILNHLKLNDDYAIQGQLVIALADLILLLHTWQNPIEDLAKQLCLDLPLKSIADNDYQTLAKSLQNRYLFAYILNQMCDVNHHSSDRPSRVGAKRREQYEDYLITKCSQAISWWLTTMEEIGAVKLILLAKDKTPESELPQYKKCLDIVDKLIAQIYLCYSAWLRIFDEQNVNDSLPLIDSAFNHLRSTNCPDNIHKAAVEVVIFTSSLCEDGPYEYLICHLVDQVYTLEAPFRQSVSDEDVEKSNNLARAFTSVGEVACHRIVIEKKDFRLIELLLSCLNHYDFEIVEETYHFWWMFLDILQTRLKHSEYGPYISYINRFIMAVTKLCQFDPDDDTVVCGDQDILSFRANSAEIIINIMYVTTVSDFIRDNNILSQLSFPITSIGWEKLEATLYLISCLTQMITDDKTDLTYQIFQGLITQQCNQYPLQDLILSKQLPLKIGVKPEEIHPQIVATSLKIIGSLEHLFTVDRRCFDLAISYIITAISNTTYRSQLIKDAAAALCNIMEKNTSQHCSNCPELLTIVKDLCNKLTEFDEDAANELVKCASYMANSITDPSVKDQFLCEIFSPILASLKNTLNLGIKNETETVKYLNLQSIFFRRTSIHPQKIFELKNFISMAENDLWPTLMNILEIYAADKDFMIEKICRCIRYMIRCIKPEWMIEKIAETMINLYRTYPRNSSPLYICSILVDEFANRSPEINKGLFAMLDIFCNLAFTLLELNASQAQSLLTMRSYPETIDDMMRLFNRFITKCTAEFFNCKALENIIELGISSLRIDHQDANENVTKFISAFISLSRDYAHVREAIRNVIGAKVTEAVLKASLFDIPPGLIGNEAQLLKDLHNFDENLYKIWLQNAVSSLPRQNLNGVECVSQEQLDDFYRTLTNSGSLKISVNTLRAFAGYYN